MQLLDLLSIDQYIERTKLSPMDQIHVMIANFIYHDDFLNSNIEDKKLSKDFINDLNSILEKLLNSDNKIENIKKIIINQSFIDHNSKKLQIFIKEKLNNKMLDNPSNQNKQNNYINDFIKIFKKDSGYRNGAFCIKKLNKNKKIKKNLLTEEYLTPWILKESTKKHKNEYYIYKFLKVFFPEKYFFNEIIQNSKSDYFIKFFLNKNNLSNHFLFTNKDNSIIDIDLNRQIKLKNFFKILIFNHFIFGNSDSKLSNFIFSLNDKNKISDINFIDWENCNIIGFIKESLDILKSSNNHLTTCLKEFLKYCLPYELMYNLLKQCKMYHKSNEKYIFHYNQNFVIRYSNNIIKEKYFYHNSFEKIWEIIKNLQIKIKIFSKTSILFKKSITIEQYFDLEFIFIEYFAKEILNISFETNIKKYKFILDNINGQFYLQDIKILDFIKYKINSKLSKTIILSLYLKYCYENKLNYKSIFNLEDFVENNKFKEIESEILANFKKDKNYKEKFLKELVEFMAHQLKIDFIKIFKYKFMAKSLVNPFSEKDLEIIVKDLEKRIFNLNEKQLKELKQLENEFPKDSKNMNLSILQENCKKFLDIYFSDK